MKRIAKAKGRKDNESVKRIRENKPFYKLDHIVKERQDCNKSEKALS